MAGEILDTEGHYTGVIQRILERRQVYDLFVLLQKRRN